MTETKDLGDVYMQAMADLESVHTLVDEASLRYETGTTEQVFLNAICEALDDVIRARQVSDAVWDDAQEALGREVL